MAFGRLGSLGTGFGRVGASGAGGVAAPAGGAALLVGEANGFATDFTYATDASRVAVKVAGTVTNYAVDAFYANAGTSPKQVFDVNGSIVWSPHNYALNSEDLTGWTNNNSSDAGSVLTATAGSSIHNITRLSGTGATLILQPWIASVSLLQGTHRYAYVTIFLAINSWHGVVVDMQAGTITQTALGISATDIPGFTPSIVSEAGGKFRVTVGDGSASTAAITLKVGFAAAATGQTFDANGDITAAPGTLNFSIERAQVCKGQVPAPYLTTTSAARFGLAIDYDPVTHAARGLLTEPAATNLLLQSSQFDNASWTKSSTVVTTPNTALAPNGLMDADKVDELAATANHTISQVVAATTGTYSVYAKAAERTLICLRDDTAAKGDFFDLSAGTTTTAAGVVTTGGPIIQSVGNGWYRCSIPTVSSTTVTIRLYNGGGALSYLGVAGSGVYLWGAQFEANPVATSQIPTFNATVTRAADNYTFLLSTIPALGAEYSIYARFSTPVIASDRYAFNVGGGVTTEVAGLKANTTMRSVVVDGSEVANILGQALVANTASSGAARYKANDCAFVNNGIGIGADLTVTMPTVTEGRFGGDGSNAASSATFRIEKVSIVPRGWTDGELATKSAT